jgi:BASS family bile acid:Na+ symporter
LLVALVAGASAMRADVARVSQRAPMLAARHTVRVGASRRLPPALSMSSTASPPTKFEKFSELFSNLFPLWTVLSAGTALKAPQTLAWFTTSYFTAALAMLMLSMGITLTVDDFKRVLSRPGPVGVGFLLCYAMMPLLALGIAKALALPPPLTAGLVLIGCINGGQASNLCAYIARGDVALSVIMTTSTTVGTPRAASTRTDPLRRARHARAARRLSASGPRGASSRARAPAPPLRPPASPPHPPRCPAGVLCMTPLLCQWLLGTMVPVDARGIAESTAQVVLAPIVLGMGLNKAFPKAVKKIEPFCPIVGVIATCLLVGSSVAQVAGPILNAGLPLQLAAMLLHAVGGLASYLIFKACKYDETISRTAAIETSMKSSAFGFLLAKLHFGEYLVRVPAAVSVVWMAIIGSSLAVMFRAMGTPKDTKGAN